MSKLIALRSAYNDGYFNLLKGNFSSQLKQQVLLFDQIGFLYLEHMLNTYSTLESRPDVSQSKFETIVLELKWLEESGIIFETKVQDLFQEKFIKAFLESNPSQDISEFQILLNKALNPKALNTRIKKTENEEQRGKVAAALQERDAITLRLMSIIMETINKVTAVTTLSPNDYSLGILNSRKNDVTQVVISKLPLPNNETPWEEIIDYRNDTENQRNLLNLRRWIRKISSENLPPNEIQEELEWLISEFQNHMKIHKIKANTETLEVIVKTPLEVIENLVKLKFSKIPEPLFAIKKRQINLLEAESNAPGREIAYIIKTKDTFQSQE